MGSRLFPSNTPQNILEDMNMFDKEELKYLSEMEDRIMQQTAQNMQIILENTVMKQLRLLAEGQQTILEMLTPKSQTAELEEEVDVVKSVVRLHSEQLAEHGREIEQLKKAQ